MGDGYTKLFSDIVDSSIWDESPEICKVWVTLLALCNADGLVRGSIGWLAAKSKVSSEICKEALRKFERPDPYSRTPDNDGRRIETLDDGWLILNYLIFRDRLSTNPIAIKTRERVRKHRERYSALRNVTGVTPSHPASASVDDSVPDRGSKGKGFKKPEQSELELHAAKIGLTATEISKFFNYYESNGWKVGRNPMKSWQAAMVNWKNNLQTYGNNGRTFTGRNTENPRNQGIIRGATDYGAIAKARQERKRQAEVAGQVAAPESPSSTANPA